MFFDLASKDPDVLALDDLTRRRTRAELVDRVTRIARLLRDDLGLRPDDRVAVLMGNRAEYVELVWGALLAGVWLVPINWHLQADEVAYILADSDARVVFADEEHEQVVRELATTRVLVTGDAFEDALSAASNEPMPADGPAGATMIYTSGTTGRPKGVKRARPATLGDAMAGLARSGRALGLDGSGPHLITGPLYHAAPLLFAIYDQAAGAPVIIMPRWDGRRALELLVERGVRHTHMVPTMFVRLLQLPDDVRARFDASSLQLVLHGAAPIAEHTKRAMIEWWGEILVEYWGATEGGVATLVDSADWLAHSGTVGRPIPTFEVFAVDDDGGKLAADEPGLLYCRHKQLTDVFEYHGDAAKTAEAYLEPGAFTTGDVGRVDDDGYVYLSDRASSMIISGGVNIYPAEVEAVLQQHEAVADVGVFGIPDDEWGEAVKAAVELHAGTEASAELEADIIAFGRARLAAYKVPRSIDFEARLPRQDTGKLYTRLLRDRYWQGRDRKI